MNLLLLSSFIRTAVQDTVGYAPKWNGVQAAGGSSTFMEIMGSHDLIFVVLAVSLIIWFVLLFFIIRTDFKVTKLEKQVNNKNREDQS